MYPIYYSTQFIISNLIYRIIRVSFERFDVLITCIECGKFHVVCMCMCLTVCTCVCLCMMIIDVYPACKFILWKIRILAFKNRKIKILRYNFIKISHLSVILSFWVLRRQSLNRSNLLKNFYGSSLIMNLTSVNGGYDVES